MVRQATDLRIDKAAVQPLQGSVTQRIADRVARDRDRLAVNPQERAGPILSLDGHGGMLQVEKLDADRALRRVVQKVPGTEFIIELEADRSAILAPQQTRGRRIVLGEAVEPVRNPSDLALPSPEQHRPLGTVLSRREICRKAVVQPMRQRCAPRISLEIDRNRDRLAIDPQRCTAPALASPPLAPLDEHGLVRRGPPTS